MKNMLVTIAIALLVVVGFKVGKYFYLKPSAITGDQASEIQGPLPDGTMFSLQDLRGKYVLIDFWGSWCGPCRQSNPLLVNLYAQYHPQIFKDASGFEIVSIGLERNPANWQDAISQDGLTWPYQLIEPSGFESQAARNYDVRQVPTKFLVNPEGVLMAVDPSIDEIDKLLKSRLKTNS